MNSALEVVEVAFILIAGFCDATYELESHAVFIFPVSMEMGYFAQLYNNKM